MERVFQKVTPRNHLAPPFFSVLSLFYELGGGGGQFNKIKELAGCIFSLIWPLHMDCVMQKVVVIPKKMQLDVGNKPSLS